MPEHTVRSFTQDLERLTQLISEMGGIAELQLQHAVQALSQRDSNMASRVVEQDARVDALEAEVNAFVVRLLALRQPMASDLRMIVGALKIAADLERIGDYASNVAKRTLALNQLAPAAPARGIPRMSRNAEGMIKDVLDAFTQLDADKAVRVRERDGEVDDLYTSLFRELLTYMMEDPRNITACTHLLFIAKNVERIGDHATNIAETVYFLVRGERLPVERAKGDTVNFDLAPGAPGGGMGAAL